MPRKMKIEAGEIAELVRQHLAGEIGVNEAGRQAGVDKKTMRRWIARYESEGIDGLLPQRKNRVYSLELILFSNKDVPYPFSLSNAHDCMCGKVVDSLTKTVNHLF